MARRKPARSSRSVRGAKRRSEPTRPAKASTSLGLHSSVPVASSVPFSPHETVRVRELFWQDVLREMLVSLVVASARQGPGPGGEAPGEQDVLDGRLGLMTRTGQRVPIGRIFPVFAATVGQSPREVTLSALLQCTVFQVHTPGGEVYTLPLHEISGFHALSEQLLAQMEKHAREEQGDGEGASGDQPFGFAAFTRLANATPPTPPNDAPKGEGNTASGAD